MTSVSNSPPFHKTAHLFGFRSVESYASVDESPFHVFIESGADIDLKPARGEQAIML